MTRVSNYGRLSVKSLPSEVLKIWYSKDAELEACEPIGFYWPTETDPELLLAQDFARRLVQSTELRESEQMVIALCVLDNCTLREAGDMLGVSPERVRQLIQRALRRFRNQSAKLTGEKSYSVDYSVSSWTAYRCQQENKRARMARG